jgi:hypothetical protein
MAPAALVVCWFGVASSTHIQTQVLLASVGVAAVAAAALTNAFWLLGGLQAVRNRRVVLHEAISTLLPAEAPPAPALGLVMVAGGTLVHETGCAAVQGKEQRKATAQRQRTLRPCPLCRPT